MYWVSLGSWCEIGDGYYCQNISQEIPRAIQQMMICLDSNFCWSFTINFFPRQRLPGTITTQMFLHHSDENISLYCTITHFSLSVIYFEEHCHPTQSIRITVSHSGLRKWVSIFTGMASTECGGELPFVLSLYFQLELAERWKVGRLLVIVQPVLISRIC